MIWLRFLVLLGFILLHACSHFNLGVLLNVLFYFLLVLILVLQLHLGGFVVQRVSGVWVKQQLWQKDFENIYQVVHRRPSLIDYIQTYRARTLKFKFESGQTTREYLRLVDVRMENPVFEADRRRLVRVHIWQPHLHFPKSLQDSKTTISRIEQQFKFVTVGLNLPLRMVSLWVH